MRCELKTQSWEAFKTNEDIYISQVKRLSPDIAMLNFSPAAA